MAQAGTTHRTTTTSAPRPAKRPTLARPRPQAGANGVAAGVRRNRPLVQALAKRFASDPASPETPLVVVNRIDSTRSIHILVVWDAWKDLTIAQRGRVIADAFDVAFPDERNVVRLAMGLTPGEALTQGHLRYQIVPMVRADDKVSPRQVRDAMASAGGVPVNVGGDRQLRFMTRAQADEAYRRLLEKINKPVWTLVEEVGASDA